MEKGKSMDASVTLGPTTEETPATAVGANNSEDKSKTMDASNNTDISKRGIPSKKARTSATVRKATMQIVFKL
jgi:hypothetical protein